jgi:DNA polymerase III gamma/tau subunit
MFQKVSILGEGNTAKITSEDIAKLTGAPRSEVINGILTAWSTNDTAKLFEIISQIEESGIDIKVLVKMLTERARYLLMKKVSPAYATTFGKRFGEKESASLDKLSYDEKQATALLKALVTLLIDGQSFTVPAVSLELALIQSIGQNV